jgi:hypothetical protein
MLSVLENLFEAWLAELKVAALASLNYLSVVTSTLVTLGRVDRDCIPLVMRSVSRVIWMSGFVRVARGIGRRVWTSWGNRTLFTLALALAHVLVVIVITMVWRRNEIRGIWVAHCESTFGRTRTDQDRLVIVLKIGWFYLSA